MLYIRRCTALSPCLGAVVDIKDRATPQYRLTKTFTWLQLWRCFFIFFYFLFFFYFFSWQKFGFSLQTPDFSGVLESATFYAMNQQHTRTRVKQKA